jgi:hypothetical protein
MMPTGKQHTGFEKRSSRHDNVFCLHLVFGV